MPRYRIVRQRCQWPLWRPYLCRMLSWPWKALNCLPTSTIKHMEYWRSAVDNVTTWPFLKFKFLDTRNLKQTAVETTLSAICLHRVSNSNPCNAVKTVIINGLAYRSLYGTNWGDGGVSLLDKLHSFLSHPVLRQPVHRQVITVRPMTVFQILFILEEKHNVEWVPLWLHVIRKCFQWQMLLVWYGIVFLEVWYPK